MRTNGWRSKTAAGAILGALVGDAAGATLEFSDGAPTASDVEGAMQMVGGGPWSTAPGQITDDGELALCLMHALQGKTEFDIERVAVMYLRWVHSAPFDIGATTARGLEGGRDEPAGRVHEGMWDAAGSNNGQSKANGGLMRIAPLAAWGRRLSEADLVQAACDECRLTHPNEACLHASAVYCVAIRHLVLHEADASGALEAAGRWAAQLGNPEVLEWLDGARENRDVGYAPQIGFVKYGFTHAFRHLALRSQYEDALAETLAGGGDTDTNACIVGGLLGALHGIDGIPLQMRDAVLECDTSQGQPRPEFLQTQSVLPALIEGLL